mmetsp:Transcript_6327/g.12862  ORF Transcript_6327/g.12862 Transcript_6327/m.12862 type:complete len:265 (-) Transcript_6327:738-1532(-)
MHSITICICNVGNNRANTELTEFFRLISKPEEVGARSLFALHLYFARKVRNKTFKVVSVECADLALSPVSLGRSGVYLVFFSSIDHSLRFYSHGCRSSRRDSFFLRGSRACLCIFIGFRLILLFFVLFFNLLLLLLLLRSLVGFMSDVGIVVLIVFLGGALAFHLNPAAPICRCMCFDHRCSELLRCKFHQCIRLRFSREGFLLIGLLHILEAHTLDHIFHCCRRLLFSSAAKNLWQLLNLLLEVRTNFGLRDRAPIPKVLHAC